VVPSFAAHRVAKQSLGNLMKDADEFPDKLGHSRTDLERVNLPHPPGRSIFSPRQARQLPALSYADLARLDVHLLQHKVKTPLVRDHIEAMVTSDQDLLKKGFRQRLEADTVRMVVRKPLRQRAHCELQVVNQFLRRQNIFKELSDPMLQQVVDCLQVNNYDPGRVLVKRSQRIKGILLVLNGIVVEQRDAASEGDMSLSGGRSASQLAAPCMLGCPSDAEHCHTAQPEFWEGRCHERSWAAADDHHVDALFLPLEDLMTVLQLQSVEDRIAAMKLFPPTKDWPEADFCGPSRAPRHGRKVLLHELFTIRTFPRQHIFFRQSELLQTDVAQVMMLISGHVQLKSKSVIVDTLAQGAMMGEEALRGEQYQVTAVCVSNRGTVLSISAADYITQFMNGKMSLPRQPVSNTLTAIREASTAGRLKPGSNALRVLGRMKRAAHRERVQTATFKGIAAGHPFEYSLAWDEIAALMDMLAGPSRRRTDFDKLLEREWKLLQEKRLPTYAVPVDALPLHKQQNVRDGAHVPRRPLRAAPK